MTEQEIKEVAIRFAKNALAIKNWCAEQKRGCRSCELYRKCPFLGCDKAPTDWEIIPEITDDDKVILRNIAKEYKWITRDKDGDVAVFSNKPIRSNFLGKWGRNCENELGVDLIKQCAFPDLFAWLRWEDEPWYIPDLIG